MFECVVCIYNLFVKICWIAVVLTGSKKDIIPRAITNDEYEIARIS